MGPSLVQYLVGMEPEMPHLEEHHDLAAMLLVGRSLKAGLPWSVDDDTALIARERVLWASLTPVEQAAEQAWLQNLWGRRGVQGRVTPVNRGWGPWAAGLPDEVAITDAAFGLPAQARRPWGKGVQQFYRDFPDLKQALDWLWTRGFQPITIESEAGVRVQLIAPAHRVAQETDRLLGMLAKAGVTVGPHDLHKSWEQVQMLATYDPVSGQAVIELTGLSMLADALSAR